ncbi:MAG: L,D-transpeptidase family protein [Spirochaetia bacterium]|nr:L,D-transpeptidase family protein [Spirochaetia bacterium]
MKKSIFWVFGIILLNFCYSRDFKHFQTSDSQQIIEVTVKNGLTAELQTFEKHGNSWSPGPVKTAAVVGRSGIAPTGLKKEGDGKTPSGIFLLGHAFGYADRGVGNMPYRQATEKNVWIDDVDSSDYNHWVNLPTNARSFERMRRNDNLYEYGLVVDYNTNPVVPGAGSAIFLHVWRNEKSPTDGCVAVSQKDLIRLLVWLDPSKKPRIIIH